MNKLRFYDEIGGDLDFLKRKKERESELSNKIKDFFKRGKQE